MRQMKASGKLFVFEGLDGSGKTTVSRALATRAKELGFKCDWFSFPGSETGTLGEKVYNIHHADQKSGASQINPTSLQLLHIAAHVDAIERKILPALEHGHFVFLDRYWWSTLVYGTAMGADKRSLIAMTEIERFHWGTTRPSRVFLLRRKIAFSESLSLEENSIQREYEKLAAAEAKKYPVSVIANDGTFNEAIQRIIDILQLGEGSASSFLPTTSRCSEPSKETRGCDNSSPFIFGHRVLPKTTIVYDAYWRFAAERQAMFFRRLAGGGPPWTSDPVLKEYKFTNAYRASDRTSQYLIREVIYRGEQKPAEVFFRTILFKLFNRIETWELLTRSFGGISIDEYSFARYDAVLAKAMNEGERIYSAAYIMPSGGRSSEHARKHSMHLKLLERMLTEDLPSRLAIAPSMEKAFELLRSYPTIGDFLAYQYVIDLNYSTLLDFSEMDFVMPGPGARNGIRKCFEDLGDFSEVDIIKIVTDRQQMEFERLGLEFKSLWGRPLQLIDCQNLFCEVDKYARVVYPEFTGLTGRARIKQKYKMKVQPIKYLYPPKWRINEVVSPETKYVPGH
jgi:thymidylate kinase